MDQDSDLYIKPALIDPVVDDNSVVHRSLDLAANSMQPLLQLVVPG